MCDVQETLLKSAWGMLVNNTKINLENQLDCCGLLNTTGSQIQFAQDVQSCTAVSETPELTPGRGWGILTLTCSLCLTAGLYKERSLFHLWRQDADSCNRSPEDPGRCGPLLQLHGGECGPGTGQVRGPSKVA